MYTTRPKDKQTYASVCREIGIPLISKRVCECVCRIRRYLLKANLAYKDVEPYLEPTIENCNILRSKGLCETALNILLGWSGIHNNFNSSFKLAKRWHPLIYAPFTITNKCCDILKKKPILEIEKGLDNYSPMIGEMACDSKTREDSYLVTGCNNFTNGWGKSKPMGAMTEQGLLENIYKLQMPVNKCYGELIYEDGKYKYTKANRTGCALCGFGITHEPDRFVKLYQTEPAKVKFAFKPIEDGGLGYKEAIEYLNKYCKCNIQIPDIED